MKYLVVYLLIFSQLSFVNMAFTQEGTENITNPPCGDSHSTFANLGSYSTPTNAFHWGHAENIYSGVVSPQSGILVKYIYFFAPGAQNSEFLFSYQKLGEGNVNISLYGFKSKTEVTDKSDIITKGLIIDQLSVNENKIFSTVKGLNQYMIKLEYQKTGTTADFFSVNFNNQTGPNCFFNYVLCEACLPGFSPIPGESYSLSAWVQQEGYSGSTTNFNQGTIRVQFLNGNSTVFGGVVFNTYGEVVDGWQKIEGVVDIPINARKIQIVLNPTSSTTHYYDDIRFFPLDGSMISYVYDQRTLRLIAELDDRNYATIYEYDTEGKLVRVKKETEKGVMTIKESRQSLAKP